jgi:hypothetical protein
MVPMRLPDIWNHLLLRIEKSFFTGTRASPVIDVLPGTHGSMLTILLWLGHPFILLSLRIRRLVDVVRLALVVILTALNHFTLIVVGVLNLLLLHVYLINVLRFYLVNQSIQGSLLLLIKIKFRFKLLSQSIKLFHDSLSGVSISLQMVFYSVFEFGVQLLHWPPFI